MPVLIRLLRGRPSRTVRPSAEPLNDVALTQVLPAWNSRGNSLTRLFPALKKPSLMRAHLSLGYVFRRAVRGAMLRHHRVCSYAQPVRLVTSTQNRLRSNVRRDVEPEIGRVS